MLNSGPGSKDAKNSSSSRVFHPGKDPDEGERVPAIGGVCWGSGGSCSNVGFPWSRVVLGVDSRLNIVDLRDAKGAAATLRLPDDFFPWSPAFLVEGLPALLVWKYLQGNSLDAQRVHTGFSLEHRTFAAEQGSQLSRSRGAVFLEDEGAGIGKEPTEASGDCTAAMMKQRSWLQRSLSIQHRSLWKDAVRVEN